MRNLYNYIYMKWFAAVGYISIFVLYLEYIYTCVCVFVGVSRTYEAGLLYASIRLVTDCDAGKKVKNL